MWKLWEIHDDEEKLLTECDRYGELMWLLSCKRMIYPPLHVLSPKREI